MKRLTKILKKFNFFEVQSCVDCLVYGDRKLAKQSLAYSSLSRIRFNKLLDYQNCLFDMAISGDYKEYRGI